MPGSLCQDIINKDHLHHNCSGLSGSCRLPGSNVDIHELMKTGNIPYLCHPCGDGHVVEISEWNVNISQKDTHTHQAFLKCKYTEISHQSRNYKAFFHVSCELDFDIICISLFSREKYKWYAICSHCLFHFSFSCWWLAFCQASRWQYVPPGRVVSYFCQCVYRQHVTVYVGGLPPGGNSHQHSWGKMLLTRVLPRVALKVK